jgi:hypothetical protein
MHITLDEEQWQLPDDISLMEALASVSDKAHAKHRLVTSLTIGGKTISDRDLAPAWLAQKANSLGPVLATSQSLHSIITEAKRAIERFAIQLRADGESLLTSLRSGTGPVGSIDAWLGRLADYTEMLEAGRTQGVSGLCSSMLLPWIQQVLEARSSADSVRVADLLEYELLPRLTESATAD